jgi:hypothetical protein
MTLHPIAIKKCSISIILMLCFSCQKNNEIAAKSPSISIQWDESSLVCIAAEGGYPRVKRLNDGSLLAAYENRKGDVLVKQSRDEGKTWSDSVLVFGSFDYIHPSNGLSAKINIANPEFIQLANNMSLFAS